MGNIGTKRRGRIIAGAVGAIVGGIYTVLAFQLPMGRAEAPGAGVFPAVVGVFLLVVSVGIAVEAALSAAIEGDIDLPRGAPLKRLSIFGGGTLAFILLLPLLGLGLSAALYLLLIIKTLGRKGWLVPVVASIALSAGLTIAFVTLLGVPLSIFPPALRIL